MLFTSAARALYAFLGGHPSAPAWCLFLTGWTTASMVVHRGLPDPGIAHRHNAQQRVPEVRGPCSNHDTICWGEGYHQCHADITLLRSAHPDNLSPSLSWASRGALHLGGGGHINSQRAELGDSRGPPVGAIWARPARQKEDQGPWEHSKDCVGSVWMLPPRVVLLRKSQQNP